MNPSQSAISQGRWGFHTVRDRIEPGGHHFRPLFVGGLQMHASIYDPGMGLYPARMALAHAGDMAGKYSSRLWRGFGQWVENWNRPIGCDILILKCEASSKR